MQRIINRVVGRHRAFSDPLQASLLQRTPGGHIGGHHGDKHRGRIRIRVPGVLNGRSDHAGSETATAQRWVRDEVVKLDGADWQVVSRSLEAWSEQPDVVPADLGVRLTYLPSEFGQGTYQDFAVPFNGPPRG